MDRIKVNLTSGAELAVATTAERNRLWREETRAAHAAYAEEVAREGLPLAAFRTF